MEGLGGMYRGSRLGRCFSLLDMYVKLVSVGLKLQECWPGASECHKKEVWGSRLGVRDMKKCKISSDFQNTWSPVGLPVHKMKCCPASLL